MAVKGRSVTVKFQLSGELVRLGMRRHEKNTGEGAAKRPNEEDGVEGGVSKTSITKNL